MASRPTFGPPGKNCLDLGWNASEVGSALATACFFLYPNLTHQLNLLKHIFHGGNDPIFQGFAGFWEGGDRAFDQYDRALHATHDYLGDIGEAPTWYICLKTIVILNTMIQNR